MKRRPPSTPPPSLVAYELEPGKVLGLVLNEAGSDGAAEGYGGYAYIAG